jgi:hypothetical protein
MLSDRDWLVRASVLVIGLCLRVRWQTFFSIRGCAPILPFVNPARRCGERAGPWRTWHGMSSYDQPVEDRRPNQLDGRLESRLEVALRADVFAGVRLQGRTVHSDHARVLNVFVSPGPCDLSSDVLRNNREEGKGDGGSGEGTLGPDGPFPRYAGCTFCICRRLRVRPPPPG